MNGTMKIVENFVTGIVACGLVENDTKSTGERSLVFQKAVLEQPILCFCTIIGVDSRMVAVVPKCSCPALCIEKRILLVCVGMISHFAVSHSLCYGYSILQTV